MYGMSEVCVAPTNGIAEALSVESHWQEGVCEFKYVYTGMLFDCALSIAWYAGQWNCACVRIVLIAANSGALMELKAGRVKGYSFATIEAAGPKLAARKEE